MPNLPRIEAVNILKVQDVIDLHKNNLKLIKALRTIRDNRIKEIDYTFTIEELIQTYEVTHKLMDEKIGLNVVKSKYGRSGTSWDLQFRKTRKTSYGYTTDSYHSITITHMPFNLNYGKRVRLTFNFMRLSVPLSDKFFKKFKITYNKHFQEIVSLDFENPNEIIEILLFLEYKIFF